MENLVRTINCGIVFGIIIFIVIRCLALTKTGFAIVNDGERGILKTGTKYDMTELTTWLSFPFLFIKQLMLKLLDQS